ncbi:multi-sensor signal transduction histidine kinase [hydrocarbon metagenome]|uniref:histidine kinase n=1 Tax=hydrocarbon metagenome TaxID=938273 RepID=A0A0W8EV53_9ZZZZ
MTWREHWWQVTALVIIIAGILITAIAIQQQDQALRTDLLLETSLAKTGIAPGEIHALTGTPADSATPGHQALVAQLREVREAYPAVRFAYLMGLREDGAVIFYADAEPPESEDYSPPGQVYGEAPDAVRTVFASGEMTIEGPYTDRWGTWVSGFVPVIDPATGQVIAVFGMDIDARQWNHALLSGSLPVLSVFILILVLVVTFGLTQRRIRREQHLLEASEEKFSRAFEANTALMAVSTIDEGRIIDVNTTFLEALRYPREEVIGKTVSDLGVYPSPETRNALIRQFNLSGQLRNVEVTLRRKDHSLLHGLVSATAIEVAGIPHLLTVVLDITALKQGEDALRQANRQLTLLSGITRHDINNQLMALNGYIALLHENVPDPGLQDYFAAVTDASARIAEMIRFTADYEQIGANPPVWQGARAVVEDAAQDVALGSVRLVNDIPEDLVVFADPLIVRVFSNLAENAVRHGGPVTTIRFSGREQDGMYLILCEDDGVGVPAAAKEEIFERGVGKNTGLGLFLSREILAITGITIRETGEEGEGARFTITVPEGCYRWGKGGESVIGEMR